MSDRNMEYVILPRRKPNKVKQYYVDEDADDDEDEDDDGSQIYSQIVRPKPRREQRIKYISKDDIDYDERKQKNDPRIKLRKTTSGDQVVLDEDDNIIKVIRNGRTPTPTPPDDRRLKHRPRESQQIFYETASGRLVSRPHKKHVETKKTQIVYADDEPTRVIKKVIIDPRTGAREVLYEKEKPKRRQKYYMRPPPAEVLIDSDDEDDQVQMPYVKLVKPRRAPVEDSMSKYVMIKKKADSEPIYSLTSRMPPIKSHRRIVYESPTKKSSTTYVYATDGKYYK